MASLFLSYDHADAGRAAPIAEALEKAGHEVWWDRHIKGGAEYNEEIEAAVEKADAVVVLWSKRSIRSAWVRDEAAEGRERGKLVPVLIDPIKPPMGFRQFQTIDITRSIRSPGGASFQQILDTIDALTGDRGKARATSPNAPSTSPAWKNRKAAMAALGIAALLGAGGLFWTMRGDPALAVVSVAPAEPSQRSQALSGDLVVKLGSLANVGSGKWQLADPQLTQSKADLIFRVAGTGSAAKPEASLVLLDGKRNAVLWSRQFAPEKANDAELRLQLSMTAGKVLSCALEARETGGLSVDLLKLFLAGCAEAVETSETEPHKTARAMRAIVDQAPRFEPAWTRLLLADIQVAGLIVQSDPERATARKVFLEDLANARKFVPDMPLLKIIELDEQPLAPLDFVGLVERLTEGRNLLPDMAFLWLDEASALASVGRMADSVESARRAVELDPLSPRTTADYINTLAWSGRTEAAREELRKAESKWPGTGAVRDAQWAFHLRYGDLKFAMSVSKVPTNDYIRARLNPTPANIDAVVADIQQMLARAEFDQLGYTIQALGEFDKTEEAFLWLNRAPAEKVANLSYVLFRPAQDDIRRDPRFMAVAKRIGLLNYWQKTGEWPDFCSEPELPYDCKAEARKLG